MRVFLICTLVVISGKAMAEKVVETQREPTSISIAAPEMHEDTIDSSNNYDKSQSNVEDFVVLGEVQIYSRRLGSGN